MEPRRHNARRRKDLPRWADGVAVVATTGVSLFLGFFHLTERSLWLDEGYTWLSADQRLKTIFAIAHQQGWHLVPYFLLIHATIAVFGDSPFVLRAPSVVIGALCVPLVYMLGVRLTGRLASLVAGVLFAVSEPFVFWQQNARDYTLVVFFALASTLAGVVGLRNRRAWPLVVWILILGLGSYTHPEMFFLAPVQAAVFLLWAPSTRTRLTVVGLLALAGLASLPVLGEATHSNVYQLTFLNPPSHGTATEIASFLASAASSTGPVTAANHALLGITFAIVVVGVARLGSDLADNGCTAANLGPSLFLGWAVVPMLLAWLVSETGREAFIDRYVILSLPGVALFVAHTLMTLGPRGLGLFVAAYLTIFHAGLLAGNYADQIDDYRGATTLVLSQARPDDCVTFQSNGGRVLYDYYDTRLTARDPTRYHSPPQVLPNALNGDPSTVLTYNGLTIAALYLAQQPAPVAQAAVYCQRIFVVESHTGSPTGPLAQVQMYYSLIHLEDDLRLYYRLGSDKIFPGVVVTVWDRVRVPS